MASLTSSENPFYVYVRWIDGGIDQLHGLHAMTSYLRKFGER